MTKKILYLFIALALSGCQAETADTAAVATEDRTTAEATVEEEMRISQSGGRTVVTYETPLSLAEAQEMFPYVVKGTYTSVEYESRDYTETGSFQIEEVFQGDLTEEKIQTKRTAVSGCKEGETYILFLEKDDDVYVDGIYYLPGCRVKMEKESGTLVYEGIYDCPYETEEELTAAISSTAVSQDPEAVHAKEAESDYIHSDDLQIVAEQSPYIADVDVVERVDEGVGRGSYRCRVTKVWKGDLNDEIEVVLPGTDDLSGEKYTLLLDTVEENSTFYVISSKHSVLEYGSDEVQMVYHYCE